MAAGLLTLLVAACGSGSNTAPSSSTTPNAKGGRAHRSSSGGSAVTSGPVHATLRGQTHHPVANKNWTYKVTVSDAQGRPLSGSAETEFAFQGSVVGKETPPTHKIKDGRLKDVLQFPPTAVGYPVELQVVVHTHLGSVTLDWPVTVHK